MSEVMKRPDQTDNQVLAQFRSKLSQQSPFTLHVWIGDCVTAEIVAKNLQEVISEER